MRFVQIRVLETIVEFRGRLSFAEDAYNTIEGIIKPLCCDLANAEGKILKVWSVAPGIFGLIPARRSGCSRKDLLHIEGWSISKNQTRTYSRQRSRPNGIRRIFRLIVRYNWAYERFEFSLTNVPPWRGSCFIPQVDVKETAICVFSR